MYNKYAWHQLKEIKYVCFSVVLCKRMLSFVLAMHIVIVGEPQYDVTIGNGSVREGPN